MAFGKFKPFWTFYGFSSFAPTYEERQRKAALKRHRKAAVARRRRERAKRQRWGRIP